MWNTIYAILAGAAVSAALYFPGLLKLGESIVPGVFFAVVVYFLLARRTFKRVEQFFMESSKALQTPPPKFDVAIRALESAYAFAPKQFGIRSQVDTQIGVIHFLKQDYNKAMPLLQRSLGFGHWLGGAMLGVIQYKKKDHEAMHKTFEVVTRRGKKQGLAWCLYGYLLTQLGKKDEAIETLSKGVEKAKDDQRVKDALLAVQNGKKIKMKAFKDQWYQFHLERPPADYRQVQMQGRVGKAARRGRW